MLALLQSRGPSSETYGILGRVYKDCWEKGKRGRADPLATALLNKAIDAYLKSFEADWRDPYAGINAVTLMELASPPDPRRLTILPIVSYAVERRIADGKPDYWDHATRLELAILASDGNRAMAALSDLLISVREVWELETTLSNLRLIRNAREQRKEPVSLMQEIEKALEERRTQHAAM